LQFGWHFFSNRTSLIWRLFSGYKTRVLKMLEWALFAILGMNSAWMGLEHFTRFSKNGRIGKRGVLWGFRGLKSPLRI